MKILVLNSGSSSLKYQLIDMETEKMLVKGNYERIGEKSFLTHKVNNVKHKFEHPAKNHEEAIQFVLDRLLSEEYGVISDIDEIDAVGHRIVHGGERFKEPVLIDEDVIEEIEKCTELAPLHNPAAVLGIKACMKVMPFKKMVAVFDTAFHQTIPEERYIYAIPYRYYEKYGVRKYGAHGTSHKYVAYRVAELLRKPIEELKIVNCHLGQGASVCAIQNGKSVETSMGLTPLGGIPMGTRSGDLDPSVLIYLMEKENIPPKRMNEILNKESGVFGISEISVDFRDIENEALAGGKQANLALDIFAYSVACYIAKCAVAMGGIDVLTFTAGVGEKGPISRAQICDYLGFLGVKIDKQKNDIKGEEQEISSSDSRVKIWVIPTDEELMIARDTASLIKK